MSGLVGSKLNIRGSGLVGSLGTDGQHLLSAGAGVTNVFETVSGGGITVADAWRLTTDFAGDANPIASNLERVDQTIEGNIGSAMTESSGIFTFPSTGIYLVTYQGSNSYNGDSRYVLYDILGTVDNSTYISMNNNANTITQTGGSSYTTAFLQSFVDVTNVTNVKVAFKIAVEDDSTATQGSSSSTITGFSFIRLGDT